MHLLLLQACIRQPTVPFLLDQTSISTAISILILSSTWKTRRKFTVSALHLSFNWILTSVFSKHLRSPCMNMKLPFLRSGATFKVLSSYFSLIVPDFAATDFAKLHPEYVAENNAMGFMSENGGEKYNLCHCESRPHPFFLSP